MTAQDSGNTNEQKPTERSGGRDSTPRAKLLDVVGRYFLMRDAIQRAKDMEFRQADSGYAEYACARQCVDATKRLEPDSAGTMESIAILRAALHFALDAWRARRGIELGRDLPTLWPAFLEHVDGSKLSERLTSHQRTLMQEFIESSGLLSVAPLSAAKRTELGELLETIVEELVGKLDDEALSLSRLRTTRILRLVLIPATVLLGITLGVWSLARPNNLALHKSVQLSSIFNPEAYPPSALVDGEKERLAIHTTDEATPWAVIDLGESRKIDRVVVENRKDIDGRSVPLHVETSQNGVDYQPFAHRDAPFKTWNAKASSRSARYVRLTLKATSSLQLSEVEVY